MMSMMHYADMWKMDGIGKLVLCKIILGDPTDTPSRNTLQKQTKADIIAFRKVLEALLNLPIKPSKTKS